MKGSKFRVILIYFLVVVLFGLACYLVYFVLSQSSQTKEETVPEESEEVADNCKIDATIDEFNHLATNPTSLTLCEGYNQINITDIALNDNVTDVYAIYYNGTLNEKKTNLGLYMNGNQITSGASYDETNTIGVFDNLLFIKKVSVEDPNLFVFNSEGSKLYDFKLALSKAKLEDPVLTELAKTDNSINAKVLIGTVDESSYNFTNGSFTFSTGKNECVEGQTYKGSTYSVSYSGETFADPVFVSNVEC